MGAVEFIYILVIIHCIAYFARELCEWIDRYMESKRRDKIHEEFKAERLKRLGPWRYDFWYGDKNDPSSDKSTTSRVIK